MVRLRLEICYFFTCLGFLSRIPIPKWVCYESDWLAKGMKYSPLIGILLGAIQGLVYLLFVSLFGTEISLLLSFGFLLILTGAFHEDGFTDFCDGIGGGWKREDILKIMKDSRIGSFGSIAILVLFLVKWKAGVLTLVPIGNPFLSIQNHPSLLLFVFLFFMTAHALSRFLSYSFLLLLPYAREEGTAKPLATEVTFSQWCLSAIFGLFPFVILVWIVPKVLFAFALLVFPLWYMYYLMKRWMGGFTGDALGAVQQVSETILWLSGVLVWKSI